METKKVKERRNLGYHCAILFSLYWLVIKDIFSDVTNSKKPLLVGFSRCNKKKKKKKTSRGREDNNRVLFTFFICEQQARTSAYKAPLAVASSERFNTTPHYLQQFSAEGEVNIRQYLLSLRRITV